MHIDVLRGDDLVFSDGPCVWSISGPWLIIHYQDGKTYMFSGGDELEVRVYPDEDDE
jgi:hypothetical protein